MQNCINKTETNLIAMERNRCTFVRFIRDEFNNSSKIVEVKDRNVDNLKIDNNVSSFYFFDQITFTEMVDGKNLKFTSDEFNVSPRHFYGGRIISREEYFKAHPNSDAVLLTWDEFCKARVKDGSIAFMQSDHIFIPERN